MGISPWEICPEEEKQLIWALTTQVPTLGFGRVKAITQPLAELHSNIISYTAMDIEL